jgi:hypothetical protein
MRGGVGGVYKQTNEQIQGMFFSLFLEWRLYALILSFCVNNKYYVTELCGF